ncbi:MAG: sensor histidine kinase [Ignavibacteria bacterium]
MSWNLYSLLIITTILLHLTNVIIALILARDSSFKFGFYLITFGLIVISIFQLSDFLSVEPIAEGIFLLSPFELTSLIGTVILFLTLFIFLLTKKYENRIQQQENIYFYSPSHINTFTQQKSQETVQAIPKKDSSSTLNNQKFTSPAESAKTKEKKHSEVNTTIETKAHIKEIPTNGKAVIAKFITKEEPRSEIDKIKDELDKIKFQRDKLVSIISHDLRTPLNSVFGYCQLLKDGQYKNKNEVKQFAENIFELSRQQLNALNRIIEWTRYESPSLALNPTNFDVTSTINFVVKTMSKIAVEKNIKIIVNSSSELYVYGDEFMIIEVLKNLLDNAIKFSHPDSSIEIHTHYHEKLNKLVVLVVDSGIGIDRDILMNLLVSTKKFTTRGTKGEKGLGLGLLIVKAIIDKHGEHFWIASEEGKWTRVYFTLKPSEFEKKGNN